MTPKKEFEDKEGRERADEYKAGIEMHESGRYQNLPSLNEIYEKIIRDINENPAGKYVNRLYKLKKEIENIQNKRY